MMNLLDDATRRDPFPLYARLRAACPVLQEPGSGMWLLLDHDSVKRAVSDHESFSSVVTPPTGKAPDWLIFSDPPRHTRRRALILRAFTGASIAALEPRITALSRALLDRAATRGDMDLVADYAAPLPAMVIAELLGIPAEDRPRFLRWGEVIMTLSYAIAGGEEADRAMRENAAVKEEMRGYLAGVLAAPRRGPRPDLLTRLADAEVDGERLTEEDLLGFFQLLLAAGTETTTNAISNAVLCLLEHPAELARLRAQPALLPSAVEEVLRFRTPGQIMFRTAARPVELRGQTIPTGALVLAVIGAANRDPARFSDPDRFDVTRAPNHHLAFGRGIHFCLGAALARLETRVALGHLLELEGLARASDAPWEPRRALNVHGPHRLPVRFAARPA